MHTKFEASRMTSMEGKQNERTDEQISQESPLILTWYKSNALKTKPSLRLLAFIVPENSLTKNFTLAYIGRRKNERTNERISQESPLSLTRYKSSLLHCIPNLRLLAFIVPEKSLTKIFNIGLYGEKEEWKNQKAEKAHCLLHDISHHYNKKKKKRPNTRKCDRQKLDFLSNNYYQGTLFVYQI